MARLQHTATAGIQLYSLIYNCHCADKPCVDVIKNKALNVDLDSNVT